MTEVFDKSELAKLYPTEEIDYTSLEKRIRATADEMQSKFNKQAGRQTIFFDLECSGLNKLKKSFMTMRSLDTDAVQEIHEFPKMDKVKIEKLKEAFPKVIAIGSGIDMQGLSRIFAKSFPLTPPPGMQTVVIDSYPELRQAEQALQNLGQAGIRGYQAGKKLNDAMIKLSNCSSIKIKGKNRFINDGDAVSYSRQQSQKWANSYSHKRPKKL